MSISWGVWRGVAVGVALMGLGLPAQAAWVAADVTAAQISKTLATTFDANGNPTRVLISQQTKRADGVVESMTTLNENTYYAPNLSTWRLGQVDTVKATHTQGSSVIVKTSKLVYDSATGAVAQEINEPNAAEFKVVTRYVRDAWGNVTLTGVRADFSAAPLKRVPEVTSTTTYDGTLHLFPVSERNALGHTVTRTYDLANGYLLSETGLNGLTTRYQYDILGRGVANLLADGSKTLTTYHDCVGNALCPSAAKFYVHTRTVKDPDNALPAGGAVDAAGTLISPNTYTHFDSLRRELYTYAEMLDGRFAVVGEKKFNAKGQVIESTEPWFSGDAPKRTAYVYDVYGRLVKTTHPAGTTSTLAYSGLRTTYTNELAQKKVEELGLQGKPVKVTEAAGTAGEATTLYSYDALGRLLAITDPIGQVRRYTYDLAGNKLTDQDPSQGTWSYQYDGLGRLISQTDAKNQTTRMVYDVLGRVIQRQAPDFNSQWTYDTASKGLGKLAQVTASNGYSRTHSYDSLGRATGTVTRVDNQSYQLSTAYDAFGRVKSLTYPTGFSYQNEYNSRGFLTKVKSQDGLRTYWQINDGAASTSDASGRLLKATLGNGVAVNRSYDPLTGQLSAQWAGNNAGANNVQNEGYLFNDAGNLQSRSDYLSNLTEHFQYDAHNRLSSATVVGQAARTVLYDKVGNITFKSDVGHYRYHANRPQAVAQVCRGSFALDGSCAQSYATYQYDANGNITSGGNRNYVWTAFNKPLSISRNGKSEGFAYDADYERIKHTHTDGAVTLYINPRLDSGAHFEVKKKGASTEYTHHVYAGGEAVAAIVTLNTGAETALLTQDFASGTAGLVLPSAAADPAGTVQWDASSQRLTLHTRPHDTVVAPLVRGSAYYSTTNGIKLRVDISLGSSATTGGRLISLGLNNAGSSAAAATGLRDIRAYINGSSLYALATSKNPNASGVLTTTYKLGNVSDNTSYTLEIEAHNSGSTLYFYPKGSTRAAGYRYQSQVPQLGDMRFVAYGRGGPTHSESLAYLDNLRIAEGGISVTKDAPYERYLHKDHLGSIVAVTDNQGRLLERFSYDAWGKRRNLNGSDDQNFEQLGQGLLPSLSTHHGFTGHEMLDDMSLVHMNGRIYDPLIARFVSADPFIDGLYSSQGLNSYSYVRNNPLNATDPNGYWSLSKAFKKLGSKLNHLRKKIGTELNRPAYQVIRALGPMAQPILAVASVYFCGPAAAACVAAVNAGGNFHIARANGAGTMQAVRIGAISGASAYAANGIGTYTYGMAGASRIATSVALHAVRGGVTSAALGGDFRSGFVGGAFGAFADTTGLSSGFGAFGDVGGIVGSAIAGGVGAKLTGGNFAEGALQAVIGHVFNDMMHPSEPTLSGHLPGTEAGEAAAEYWADRLVGAGGGFWDDPVAGMGLGLSVLWTGETALSTAGTLLGGGVTRGVSWAMGPAKQWLRVGPSYSHAAGQRISLSIRWGASPAGGGKYIRQIPSKNMQELNQWVRQQKLPGSNWRVQDSGHLHLKR